MPTAGNEIDETIYVRLTNEVIPVWRPVPAKRITSLIYTIAGDDPDPEIEPSEFCSGERVRVELRDLSEGTVLIAIAKAP